MSGTAALGVLIAMFSAEPTGLRPVELMPRAVLVKHAHRARPAPAEILVAFRQSSPELDETIGEVEYEHRWLTARARIGNEDGELMPDGFLLTELTVVAKVRPSLDLELQLTNSIDEDWREAQLAEAISVYGGHGMTLSSTLTATAAF